MKAVLEEKFPVMKDADVGSMLEVIEDPKFRVLQPQTEETEQLLEEMTPIEDQPWVSNVVRDIKGSYLLTEKDKALLSELFDSLEVAHGQVPMASSTLGRLSRILKSQPLLLVLRASVHPMIQMNVVSGLLKSLTTSRKSELPDHQPEWVKMLITPDPTTKS